MSAAAVAAAAAVASAGAGIAGAASSGKGGSKAPPKPAAIPTHAEKPLVKAYNPAELIANQSAENQRVADYNNIRNNANLYGPAGSSTWEINPDGTKTQHVNLDPRIMGVIGGLLKEAPDVLSSKWTGGADLNAARNETIDAIMSRANPQMDRETALMNSELANAGIVQGSEAWKNRIDAQNRAKNDMWMAAELAGNTEQNTLFGQHLAQQQSLMGSLGQLYGLGDSLRQGYNFTPMQSVNTMAPYDMAQAANIANAQIQAQAEAANAGATTENQNMAYNQQIASQNARADGWGNLASAGINGLGSALSSYRSAPSYSNNALDAMFGGAVYPPPQPGMSSYLAI